MTAVIMVIVMVGVVTVVRIWVLVISLFAMEHQEVHAE
jgi:hypothetical protein